MRILFLAPRFVLPADTGGKIRTYNLIKQLAKIAELHLICFSFEKEDRHNLDEFAKLGIAVTLIPLSDDPFYKKMIAVIDSAPFSVAKYYSREMAKAVTLLVEKHHFDAVHVDHIHMAQYQNCFEGLPCLVDEHNVEYKIMERCGNVETAWWKQQLYFQQASKMRRFEAHQLPHFSACTAVSSDDANILREITDEKVPVHILPNGVDTEFFAPNFKGEKEEDALVFTGSMDWLPNEDAVLYFIKEMLPLIWQENPKVQFYVVGKSPSTAIFQARKNDERIIVTQRVDDVRPYLTKSRIFVAPLRIGGGTRLKILEAMAMERTIVSTSIGAEGISYTDDRDLVIADRPQEFAKKVLMLLNLPEKRKSLGKAGRQLVLEKYDWSIMGTKLQLIYGDIVNGQKK